MFNNIVDDEGEIISDKKVLFFHYDNNYNNNNNRFTFMKVNLYPLISFYSLIS